MRGRGFPRPGYSPVQIVWLGKQAARIMLAAARTEVGLTSDRLFRLRDLGDNGVSGEIGRCNHPSACRDAGSLANFDGVYGPFVVLQRNRMPKALFARNLRGDGCHVIAVEPFWLCVP